MGRKEMIINALGEAREHLILNKYNEGMMLMAQITIDTIAHLVDEALIVSKGYEEDLKTLKAVGVLSDDTAHNFETLILSGVQAHNGVDIPKEHAETALKVLSNELDMIFAKEDKKENDVPVDDNKVYEYDESEPYKGDFSRDMTSDGATPAFMQNGADGDFRKKERIREEMLAMENRRGKRNIKKLIAIIIPIILVLLIVFVVKAMFFSGGPKTARRIEEPTVPVEIETTEMIETEPTLPPLPAEAGYYDVTGDLVKIRDGASTEGTKVIGLVNKGDKVQVKSFYNTDWAVVVYEGKEAFVSRRYIKKDESLSPVFEESAAIVEEEQ